MARSLEKAPLEDIMQQWSGFISLADHKEAWRVASLVHFALEQEAEAHDTYREVHQLDTSQEQSPFHVCRLLVSSLNHFSETVRAWIDIGVGLGAMIESNQGGQEQLIKLNKSSIFQYQRVSRVHLEVQQELLHLASQHHILLCIGTLDEREN